MFENKISNLLNYNNSNKKGISINLQVGFWRTIFIWMVPFFPSQLSINFNYFPYKHYGKLGKIYGYNQNEKDNTQTILFFIECYPGKEFLNNLNFRLFLIH